IVTYIPSNAYVVRADYKAAARLASFVEQNSFAQFVGTYDPAFRLTPSLRAMRSVEGDQMIDVTVQVVEGGDADQTIANLQAIGEFVSSYSVLNYRNIELRVSPSQLTSMSRMANVFAVEERGRRRRLDEAQGQIVAGNLSG